MSQATVEVPLVFSAPKDPELPPYFARHAPYGKAQEIKPLVWYAESGGARNLIGFEAVVNVQESVLVSAAIEGKAGVGEAFDCLSSVMLNGEAAVLDHKHQLRIDAQALKDGAVAIQFRLDQASFKMGNKAFRLEVYGERSGALVCASEWVVVATKPPANVAKSSVAVTKTSPKRKQPTLAKSPLTKRTRTVQESHHQVPVILPGPPCKGADATMTAEEHLNRAESLKKQREALEREEMIHRAAAARLVNGANLSQLGTRRLLSERMSQALEAGAPGSPLAMIDGNVFRSWSIASAAPFDGLLCDRKLRGSTSSFGRGFESMDIAGFGESDMLQFDMMQP